MVGAEFLAGVEAAPPVKRLAAVHYTAAVVTIRERVA